jgi:hypothetical protein
MGKEAIVLDDKYSHLMDEVRRLDRESMRKLRDGITALLEVPPEDGDAFNIMELEGLGKEVWEGIDAREYVRRERDSWRG